MKFMENLKTTLLNHRLKRASRKNTFAKIKDRPRSIEVNQSKIFIGESKFNIQISVV